MLINLRNALMAGKRTPTAKDYVQDGLVGLYDGVENGGYGVHDLEQTAWSPCVGASSMTQFNASRYTGHSYFQNESIYWRGLFQPTTTGGATALINSNNFTVEFLCERMSYIFTYCLRTESSQVVALGGALNVGYLYDSQISLGTKSIGDVTLFTFTADGTNLKLYQNATLVDSVAIDSSITTSNAFGIIKCNIYRVGEYSRALTASEIAANYAIDKARFGLS